MTTASRVGLRYLVSLVLSMALVACGGDGDNGAVTAAPTAEEDKVRAEGVVLSELDLPGLIKQPAQDETDAADAIYNECINDNPLLTEFGEGARGAESDYRNGEQTIVRGSSAAFAEHEEEATAAIAELRKPTFAGCFERALQVFYTAEIGDEAEVKNVEVSALVVEERGDESVGYRARLDLTGRARSVVVSFEFVFVRVGRGMVGLSTQDIGQPLEAAERSRLTQLLANRLEVAVA